MITNPIMEQYIEQLIPTRSPLLQRLEQEAEAEGIPIIQLSSAQLLRLLLLIHQPKNILEVGTAIGYSTLWLAEASREAQIVTIEIDQERIARAKANFVEAGVSERIKLIEGDATQGLSELGRSGEYQFDCLFIDAAKGQYQKFLEMYLPMLNEGGIIITDNILFRGLVASPEDASKRQKPMVEKIDAYNALLMTHPQLETSIIPIGDGIALSVKRTKI